MKVKAYGITDIGQKRPINQDSYKIDASNKLYIVADGMGGHKGGEVASALAVNSILNFIKKNKNKYKKKDAGKKLIQFALKFANDSIIKESEKNSSLKGMGTTVSLLYIDNNNKSAVIGNVGDSRTYLLSNNNIWQITEDHSYFEEQKRSGLLPERRGAQQQGNNLELKSILTRSVGIDKELKVDLFQKKLENNDYYFICSDGLHNYIPDMEIKNTIFKLGPEEGINKLITLANNRGGDDNITAVCIRITL